MLKTRIKEFIRENGRAGKREAFALDSESLDGYLGWAFFNDYLFLVPDKNGFSGVGVAYPIPKPFDGTIESLLIYEDPVEGEHDKEIVIMDWVTTNSEARRDLVRQFKKRFWNWGAQKKWGIHYGKVKSVSNDYVNKMENF